MISAILLAAGESRRMGAQKVLLPYRGITVIESIVRAALAAADEVVVVLGHDPEPVAEVLATYSVKIALNAEYQQGMLSSVRTGLRALSPEADAFLLLLGDQPQVRPALLRQLVRAFDAHAGKILLPSYQGRAGHPPVIAARFRQEILTGHDSTGLRGLYTRHPNEVVHVEVDDASIIQDMDTPEDYQRLSNSEGAPGQGT